ncbi:MAG: NAD(P)-binding domain-containing protein, partial [Actinobacteria bacterium]|nr:NAD(P)-binding domain-containing protein [Actinomycetota bacterium]
FEAGSQTGGNWRYHNDNGMSSAYRSLRAKSSSRCMQYGTFPMPDDYPDYPGHELIARYLDDFVEHFGFRERIQFRTEVTEVRQAAGAGWDVTVRHRDTGTLRTQQYGAVLVANGHHWDPRYPEPVLPGADTFAGEQIHSHGYHTPEPFAGKRVVVVGIGNSGCDVAAECAEVAGRTVLSVRRGVHVVPQYLCGRPTDYLTQWRLGTRAPLAMQSAAVAAMVRLSQGSLTKYGLPKPDHQVHRGPPTLSDSLPGKLASGAITVRPAIERFRGESVCFTDGTVEQADVVIYCTGYKISFPFLDSSLVGADDECVALYHRVIPPSLPGLYLIGLVQPIGAIMPLAEIQSEWVADLLQGRATLPPRDEMEREIASYRAATANRYARASRHDIQVDFLRYVREISRERRVSASCGWRSRTSRYKARPSDPETCDATGADAKDRSVMTEPRVLLSGLGIPESPRWHDGRLWFCNWIDRQVMAVDMDGKAEVMVCRDPASHPMGYSIDWLPDGRLLTTGDKVRRQEPDGSMAVHAEQRANEIVVDVRGNAYINGADFDFVGGAPPQPGYIKVITPDGQLRQV